jgi:hypothetical protein
MHPLLNKIGLHVLGGFAILACVLIPLGFVYGSVVVAGRILPDLLLATEVAIGVCLNLLLPLCLFRFTRFISATGFLISSYVFGVALWLMGVAVVYDYWGYFGLILGLLTAVVGVVPLGMLASALHGEWLDVGNFALLIGLTFGTRLFVVHLASRNDRDTMPRNHTLAWAGKTYFGLVWMVIIFGYSTTLYYRGWEFFIPGRDHFNMLTSCLLTMILMLPGWGIIKVGEYMQRRKWVKEMAPAQ